MKYPKAHSPALHPVGFAFDLNLADEWGDGLDRVRHIEQSKQWQARVRQPRVNALADRPDLEVARQGREGLDRIISHDVVKLPHQTLVGSEHDRTCRTRAGGK